MTSTPTGQNSLNVIFVKAMLILASYVLQIRIIKSSSAGALIGDTIIIEIKSI